MKKKVKIKKMSKLNCRRVVRELTNYIMCDTSRGVALLKVSKWVGSKAEARRVFDALIKSRR